MNVHGCGLYVRGVRHFRNLVHFVWNLLICICTGLPYDCYRWPFSGWSVSLSFSLLLFCKVDLHDLYDHDECMLSMYRVTWMGDFGIILYLLCSRAASTGIPPLLCDGQRAAISPSQEVIVTKSRPGTFACTTNCGKVENLFFYRPSSESRDDINILESSIFSSVVGSVKPSSDNTTMSCSHSVNITWTNDTNIRNELDSVMCVIILKGGVSCKTENISVVFSGEIE